MFGFRTISFVILVTFALGCESPQHSFLRDHNDDNFQLFDHWSIQPRDEDDSGMFVMRYLCPVDSSDMISLVAAAQIQRKDSVAYRISVSEADKERFCLVNHLINGQVKEYVDSVFHRFCKLKVRALSAQKNICIFNMKDGSALLKDENAVTDSTIQRFGKLGYQSLGNSWFIKRK